MTHWIHAISFIALAVSGICILLAGPRIYLGETGTVAESYEWLTGLQTCEEGN